MAEGPEGTECVLPNAWPWLTFSSLFLGTQQTFKGASLCQAPHLIVGGSGKSEIGTVFAPLELTICIPGSSLLGNLRPQHHPCVGLLLTGPRSFPSYRGPKANLAKASGGGFLERMRSTSTGHFCQLVFLSNKHTFAS